MEVETLRITRSSDSMSEYDGHLTTVFYLTGDLRAAAKKFVEENREKLEQIDFSNPDVLQSELDREAYDWILHYLGERRLRKYRTVVYECRRDGTEWLVDRNQFDTAPSKRYNGDRAVRVTPEVAVDDLYETFDDTISAWDLNDCDRVDGATKYILEYYRVAGAFNCTLSEASSKNPKLQKLE